MQKYEKKNFSIPEIKGISKETIDTHIGLYEGYVKNLNDHYEKFKDCGDDPLTTSAIARRLGFELAGVKNHEQYFAVLEKGPKELDKSSNLSTAIQNTFGSVENFLKAVKHEATIMRGIGWVIVTYDAKEKQFHMLWVSDHELGNVNLPSILAVDMWEHAYMIDYRPKDKVNYIDAYLNALNWDVISETFDSITH